MMTARPHMDHLSTRIWVLAAGAHNRLPRKNVGYQRCQRAAHQKQGAILVRAAAALLR